MRCICRAHCRISTRRKCSVQSCTFTMCTSCTTFTSRPRTTPRLGLRWSSTPSCCRGPTKCFPRHQTRDIRSSRSGSARRPSISTSLTTSTGARSSSVSGSLLWLCWIYAITWVGSCKFLCRQPNGLTIYLENLGKSGNLKAIRGKLGNGKCKYTRCIQAPGTWAQIHTYCLKTYPKICHKIILRQKLWCRKMILWHILG